MTDQSRFEQLGLNLSYATEEQVAAVESLSDEELRLLVRIRQRLTDATGDVEAHAIEGGGVVW